MSLLLRCLLLPCISLLADFSLPSSLLHCLPLPLSVSEPQLGPSGSNALAGCCIRSWTQNPHKMEALTFWKMRTLRVSSWGHTFASLCSPVSAQYGLTNMMSLILWAFEPIQYLVTLQDEQDHNGLNPQKSKPLTEMQPIKRNASARIDIVIKLCFNHWSNFTLHVKLQLHVVSLRN